MHDVLRARLLRKIESLPEDQIYQVLDYIEFLESRYASDLEPEASGLQRFAEKLEDRLRRRTVSPANIREAFQLIAAADRVLSSVSSAGKQIINELNAPASSRDSSASSRDSNDSDSDENGGGKEEEQKPGQG